MNYYSTSILVLVSFYVLLLIIVFFFQRSLLYHPNVDNYLKDQNLNSPTEIENDPDGKNDVLTPDNQEKSDKSEILVLDQMIE